MVINKRGQQEGGSLGIIVTIILLAIVAIAVAYFFVTRATSGGSTIGNLLPSQLGAAESACRAAASAGAVTDFCNTPRKIEATSGDNKDQVYVTCSYSQFKIDNAPSCLVLDKTSLCSSTLIKQPAVVWSNGVPVSCP
jgi:flagellar basal body-associated protein FliL